jgi:hypothetical protein
MYSTQAPKILEHLHGVVSTKPGEWKALCPIHEADGQPHDPSLSVTAAGEKVLVHCHVCKDAAPANRIVEACGLTMADLYLGQPPTPTPSKRKPKTKGTIVATYDYRDESGQLRYQVVRMDPKDFRQRRPDPSRPDGWSWNVKGVCPVPYRLPELMAADVKAEVVICEGEKDCDRLAQLGFVTTTNSGGAGKWLPELSELLRGRRVIVIPDNDDAGERHGELVARSLHRVARWVGVLRLPGLPPKGDASDWLDQGGTVHELQHLLYKVEEWQPTEHEIDEESPADRVTIEITPEEHLVTDQVVQTLAARASLFVRDCELVRILTHEGDEPTIDGITRPTALARIRPAKGVLRDTLTRHIRFVRERHKGDETYLQDCHPPQWCIDSVANREVWPGIPHLRGIVTCPVMRADGSILRQPGYDPASELFLDYRGPEIELPDNPTQEDARKAAALLLELIEEFPFASDRARACWLACVLSPFARNAYNGPTPLFLIDANTRGSGKTLLATLAGMIFTGDNTSSMSCPSEDDEFAKRITAIAKSGDPLILIDNVAGTLGCQSLDAALTSTRWKSRLLHTSDIPEYQLFTIWMATGNNVAIGADTSRRTCHIRLESRVEKPEERSGYRYPRLLDHVRSHLHRYRAAVLTILGAYVQAGRPSMNLRHWGSFEGWSDLVRGAVVFAGLTDPGESRSMLAERSDTQANALRALIHHWPNIDPGRTEFTAAQILEHARTSPLREIVIEFCDFPASELPSSTSLGKRLSRFFGTVVDDHCITNRDSHGIKIWRVEAVAVAGGGSGLGGVADLETPQSTGIETANEET